MAVEVPVWGMVEDLVWNDNDFDQYQDPFDALQLGW
jgi:hypothetical protein